MERANADPILHNVVPRRCLGRGHAQYSGAGGRAAETRVWRELLEQLG